VPDYKINLEDKFGSLALIDVGAEAAAVGDEWVNQTLTTVNHAAVRLGVVQGEFHWHKHEREDEFFYVVEGDAKARTPADNQTVRNVFVIGPDKKVKLVLVYPMTTGRNFDEVLRVIDSLQLTAKHRVATPVNWQQGENVIIAGSVSNDEAKEIFGEWDSPKPYIRIVPQPQ